MNIIEILHKYKSYIDAKESIIKNMKLYKQNQNITNIKLYASEGTILSNIYKNVFEKFGIKINVPNESEFEKIRSWIEAVKTSNVTEDVINDFVNTLNSQNENIILGCTELPILYDKCKDKFKFKMFDPLQSTIKFLVEKQNERIN